MMEIISPLDQWLASRRDKVAELRARIKAHYDRSDASESPIAAAELLRSTIQHKNVFAGPAQQPAAPEPDMSGIPEPMASPPARKNSSSSSNTHRPTRRRSESQGAALGRDEAHASARRVDHSNKPARSQPQKQDRMSVAEQRAHYIEEIKSERLAIEAALRAARQPGGDAHPHPTKDPSTPTTYARRQSDPERAIPDALSPAMPPPVSLGASQTPQKKVKNLRKSASPQPPAAASPSQHSPVPFGCEVPHGTDSMPVLPGSPDGVGAQIDAFAASVVSPIPPQRLAAPALACLKDLRNASSPVRAPGNDGARRRHRQRKSEERDAFSSAASAAPEPLAPKPEGGAGAGARFGRRGVGALRGGADLDAPVDLDGLNGGGVMRGKPPAQRAGGRGGRRPSPTGGGRRSPIEAADAGPLRPPSYCK